MAKLNAQHLESSHIRKLATVVLSAMLMGCSGGVAVGETAFSGSPWQALRPEAIDGGIYWLTAKISGFRLSVCHNNFSEGGEVCQNIPNLSSCAQRWRIASIPGSPGYYWITSMLTTYRLDVLHANIDNGGPICQAKPNPTDAQQWFIEDVPGEPGYYRLTAKNSKLRLDVYGGNTDDNGRVCQATPNDTASQKWHLEPPATSEVCEWTGVLGTGQSLSVGTAGSPVISTTQPFANLMLSDPNFAGRLDQPAGSDAVLVPLVEPLRLKDPKAPPASAYPNNIEGETPHSAMANQLTSMVRQSGVSDDFVTIHSAVGQGAQGISVIEKGGTGNSYNAALYEARAVTALARRAGKRFSYGAILLTHGETDAGDSMYEDEIYRLWVNYNADLRAITGQATDIPLLLSQQNTEPSAIGSSASTLAQWRLGVDHPGQILCIGPKYQYEYAGDHLHLTANGYRRLGQKYAQVYFQVAVLGKAWKPLQPRYVQRSSDQLTVTFDVPVPPLRWDDRLPSPHQNKHLQWKLGRGFEVSDQAGPLTILTVDFTASDQVKLTLDRTPQAGLVLAYGMTQDVDGVTGGLAESRGGQLRDSDASIGYDIETIACTVQHGANTISPAAEADFIHRSLRDIVSGSQFADDTVITAIDRTHITLSAPWTGPTGTAQLRFHNDMHNYAVQFMLPVH